MDLPWHLPWRDILYSLMWFFHCEFLLVSPLLLLSVFCVLLSFTFLLYSMRQSVHILDLELEPQLCLWVLWVLREWEDTGAESMW